MNIFWIVVMYTVAVLIMCATEYKVYIRNGRFGKRAFAVDFGRIWLAGACIIIAALWEAVKFLVMALIKILDWMWSLMNFIVKKAMQD
ncbi:hypothetical protein AVA65_07865 [Salmonella enterica subsp. enterica serovar Minnesota]|nr:hypothetical protein [Salmonella enterica subsp. enterica serovar Minnesota]